MKKINLHGKYSNNSFALVDDEDFKALNQWKWHISNRGYAKKSASVGERQMHVIVNKTPKGLVTDHINGNRLDNQKYNLRSITRSENCFGQTGRKSGYKGVRLISSGRFSARLTHHGKEYHIGVFDTELEAAIAYNRKTKEIWGDFAKINKTTQKA